MQFCKRVALVTIIGVAAASGGCASPQITPETTARAHLPLLQGWFDGRPVLYITTDVSDKAVAEAKGANFVPRLERALAPAGEVGVSRPTSVDKVYAITNFEQASIFGSAPSTTGYLNTDETYSPLWQLIKVSWRAGKLARTLKGEEDVLQAEDQGEVTVEATRIVLNCPIIEVGRNDILRGATVDMQR